MIATALGRQRPCAVQNPAYRPVRHFYLITRCIRSGYRSIVSPTRLDRVRNLFNVLPQTFHVVYDAPHAVPQFFGERGVVPLDDPDSVAEHFRHVIRLVALFQHINDKGIPEPMR